MTVRFGPAGNCEDFYEKGYKSTVQAPEYLEKMGLDAYEYSCGRGVLLKQETAEKIGRAAADHHVALSIHAPYFTNLCNPDPAKQDATVNYIRQAAQAICWMGGTRVIFHPGALMKSTREAAHERALALMHRVTDEVLSEFPEIVLCRRRWASATNTARWRKCWLCARPMASGCCPASILRICTPRAAGASVPVGILPRCWIGRRRFSEKRGCRRFTSTFLTSNLPPRAKSATARLQRKASARTLPSLLRSWLRGE